MRPIALSLLLLASSGCATPALYDWFEGHRRERAIVTQDPPLHPVAVTRAGRARDGSLHVEVQYRSASGGATLRQLTFAPTPPGEPAPAWPSAADGLLDPEAQPREDEEPGCTAEEAALLEVGVEPWPDEELVPVAIVCGDREPPPPDDRRSAAEAPGERLVVLEPDAPPVDPSFAVRLDAGWLELREGDGVFHALGRLPSLPGARHESPGKRRVSTYVGFALALPFAAAADATLGALIAAGYVGAYVPLCCFVH